MPFKQHEWKNKLFLGCTVSIGEEGRTGGRRQHDFLMQGMRFCCHFLFVLVCCLFACLLSSYVIPPGWRTCCHPPSKCTFRVETAAFLNLFFLCWQSWTELHCKDSALFGPVFKRLGSLKWGFSFWHDKKRVFNNWDGIVFQLACEKHTSNAIVLEWYSSPKDKAGNPCS